MHLARVGEKQTARLVIRPIENTLHGDGNWTAYNPDRPASFNTALCIMACLTASKAHLKTSFNNLLSRSIIPRITLGIEKV